MFIFGRRLGAAPQRSWDDHQMAISKNAKMVWRLHPEPRRMSSFSHKARVNLLFWHLSFWTKTPDQHVVLPGSAADQNTHLKLALLYHASSWSSMSWRCKTYNGPECICLKKCDTLLDLCVSSLRRGHANLLCIVPILTDDLRGGSGQISETMYKLQCLKLFHTHARQHTINAAAFTQT